MPFIPEGSLQALLGIHMNN